MVKRTLIKVTQDDIDNGTRKDCGKCPIALAVLRQFPDAEFAQVTWGSIEAWQEGFLINKGFLAARTSRSARTFINRFDKGLPVKPFNFYAVER